MPEEKPSSDALLALRELSDWQGKHEHLRLEIENLRRELENVNPGSDKGKEIKREIFQRITELSEVTDKCKQLRGIWEREPMKAMKKKSPGQ